MQTNPGKLPEYDSKPVSYFEWSRPEMLPFVPSNCKRILDVGCGKGNFGETLKRSRAVEVWGIEPVVAAAAEAATKLDHVITGIFAPATDLPPKSFDVIFFNDVLEHLFDPAEALRHSHQLLTADGVIIASIPNIRHFPMMWELLIHKDWRYTDSGILDRTHLRFFTKQSMAALFLDCGFRVEKIEGIHPPSGRVARKWHIFKFINAVTLNAIEDMKYLQFAIVARPSKMCS